MCRLSSSVLFSCGQGSAWGEAFVGGVEEAATPQPRPPPQAASGDSEHPEGQPNLTRWQGGVTNSLPHTAGLSAGPINVFTKLQWQKKCRGLRCTWGPWAMPDTPPCVSHWHYTLMKLQAMYISNSPMCWRNCGSQATHGHIWCFFPLIRLFHFEPRSILFHCTTEPICQYRRSVTPNLVYADKSLIPILRDNNL